MRYLLLVFMMGILEAQVRYQSPATIHKPNGYSHIAEVPPGMKMVFIAGQVGTDLAGKTPENFEAQVKQMFDNLKAAVEAAGGKFTDIVKLNYLLDGSHVSREQLTAMRAIRDRYVDTEHPPVSTLAFVKELARAEWWIEVDAVAMVPAVAALPAGKK